MSCRRSDRTRLVGCRIGDVALRGCSRGCCHYRDEDISENTRVHFMNRIFSRVPPNHNLPGRTGLYFRQCQSSYRPKFICPARGCRRSIKPFYDPSKLEYEISEYQDWSVRPVDTPELIEAKKNEGIMQGYQNRNSDETREFRALQKRYYDDPSALSVEEIETVKSNDPHSWWIRLTTTPRGWADESSNGPARSLRCPSCGDDTVPVGSNFRIPSKADIRSWREVENMIADGKDMVASFSSCATVQQQKEMVDEAARLRRQEHGADEWAAEKQRRIAAVAVAK
ncbi:hypothetical protein BJ875DRAFT_466270 [Amylocarpus encephaloides]|uniref:Uncharacterized protein n=1 Tax=Amylocarpus encephaloides TaxID=45428 RepID=A0A9P7YFU2_9HELO|nr:hypothetical protein BJ875DRAFT_466270 [Amylocarpus encephaloides]